MRSETPSRLCVEKRGWGCSCARRARLLRSRRSWDDPAAPGFLMRSGGPHPETSSVTGRKPRSAAFRVEWCSPDAPSLSGVQSVWAGFEMQVDLGGLRRLRKGGPNSVNRGPSRRPVGFDVWARGGKRWWNGSSVCSGPPQTRETRCERGVCNWTSRSDARASGDTDRGHSGCKASYRTRESGPRCRESLFRRLSESDTGEAE